MKHQLAVTVTALFLLAFSGKLFSDEVTEYPIHEIDPKSEKFTKVYGEVAYAIELQKAKTKTTSRIKIIQNISDGMYLVSAGDSTYALLLPGEILVDDTELNIHVVKTEQVYQYTSVLGAKKTVTVIKEAVDSVMTKDDFLNGPFAST